MSDVLIMPKKTPEVSNLEPKVLRGKTIQLESLILDHYEFLRHPANDANLDLYAM